MAAKDDEIGVGGDPVRVFCRVRPLEVDTVSEKASTHNPRTSSRFGFGSGSGAGGTTHTPPTATPKLLRVEGKSVIAGAGSDKRTFTYDAVFAEDCAQEEIFRVVGRPITAQCLAGYNGTVFAYGQTGSGKTHTILGAGGGTSREESSDGRGLVPRVLDYLFAAIRERAEQASTEGGTMAHLCKVSFLEIYNERVFDLLDGVSTTNLQLREDISRGVYVEGLETRTVSCADDAIDAMRDGANNRHVGATAMNRESSRSHSVFTLTIQTKHTDASGLTRQRSSRFHLVDLAGSERQKSTAATGERLREASSINRSLSALGNVIHALADKAAGKQRHVAYRDSKLTFLLKDSLGGNSLTFMVATVSPAIHSYPETLSTLKFASNAKKIKNTAVVNENTTGNVLRLQAEIKALRAQLQLLHRPMPSIAIAPASGLVGDVVAVGDTSSELLDLIRDSGLQVESAAASAILAGKPSEAAVAVAAAGSLDAATSSQRVAASRLADLELLLCDVIDRMGVTEQRAAAAAKLHARRRQRVQKLQECAQSQQLQLKLGAKLRQSRMQSLAKLQRGATGTAAADSEAATREAMLEQEVALLRKQLTTRAPRDGEASGDALRWLVRSQELEARVEELEYEREADAPSNTAPVVEALRREVRELVEERQLLVARLDAAETALSSAADVAARAELRATGSASGGVTTPPATTPKASADGAGAGAGAALLATSAGAGAALLATRAVGIATPQQGAQPGTPRTRGEAPVTPRTRAAAPMGSPFVTPAKQRQHRLQLELAKGEFLERIAQLEAEIATAKREQAAAERVGTAAVSQMERLQADIEALSAKNAALVSELGEALQAAAEASRACATKEGEATAASDANAAAAAELRRVEAELAAASHAAATAQARERSATAAAATAEAAAAAARAAAHAAEEGRGALTVTLAERDSMVRVLEADCETFREQLSAANGGLNAARTAAEAAAAARAAAEEATAQATARAEAAEAEAATAREEAARQSGAARKARREAQRQAFQCANVQEDLDTALASLSTLKQVLAGTEAAAVAAAAEVEAQRSASARAEAALREQLDAAQAAAGDSVAKAQAAFAEMQHKAEACRLEAAAESKRAAEAEARRDAAASEAAVNAESVKRLTEALGAARAQAAVFRGQAEDDRAARAAAEAEAGQAREAADAANDRAATAHKLKSEACAAAADAAERAAAASADAMEAREEAAAARRQAEAAEERADAMQAAAQAAGTDATAAENRADAEAAAAEVALRRAAEAESRATAAEARAEAAECAAAAASVEAATARGEARVAQDLAAEATAAAAAAATERHLATTRAETAEATLVTERARAEKAEAAQAREQARADEAERAAAESEERAATLQHDLAVAEAWAGDLKTELEKATTTATAAQADAETELARVSEVAAVNANEAQELRSVLDKALDRTRTATEAMEGLTDRLETKTAELDAAIQARTQAEESCAAAKAEASKLRKQRRGVVKAEAEAEAARAEAVSAACDLEAATLRIESQADTIRTLESKVADLEKETQGLHGHQNQHQKIRGYMAMKHEYNALKAKHDGMVEENFKLRNRLSKLDAMLAPSSSRGATAKRSAASTLVRGSNSGEGATGRTRKAGAGGGGHEGGRGGRRKSKPGVGAFTGVRDADVGGRRTRNSRRAAAAASAAAVAAAAGSAGGSQSGSQRSSTAVLRPKQPRPARRLSTERAAARLATSAVGSHVSPSLAHAGADDMTSAAAGCAAGDDDDSDASIVLVAEECGHALISDTRVGYGSENADPLASV